MGTEGPVCPPLRIWALDGLGPGNLVGPPSNLRRNDGRPSPREWVIHARTIGADSFQPLELSSEKSWVEAVIPLVAFDEVLNTRHLPASLQREHTKGLPRARDRRHCYVARSRITDEAESSLGSASVPFPVTASDISRTTPRSAQARRSGPRA
jgi:hypothetical protein